MSLQNTGKPWMRASAAFLLLAGLSFSAIGDELQDVKMLFREGKLTEALAKADKVLEQKQTDPSMLFMKGLILSEQKKTGDAIGVFSKLTADFPDYPEPYNNLAVLFATDGQYDKARIALETALKLNPQYVTAQENMGDVFLRSAMQAYSDATKNDASNTALKAKLRAVRHTLGLPPNESPSATTPLPAPVLVGTAGPAAVEKTKATDPKQSQAERELVLKTVDQWVRAWSAKDTKAYFALYSDDFRTPNGETKERWKKMRRARIEGKDQIDVQVLSPSVTVEDKIAVVNFQQVYVAGKISANDRKSLTLTNQDGSWKILQEKTDR